jgi:RNA polymerase sigma-70 factor, ECF subfamily
MCGDPLRFDRLYELHSLHVYNLLRRLLDNDQDAEDATVETFRRAYQGLDRFRGDCSEKVWVMSIAQRVAMRTFSVRAKRSAVSLSSEALDGLEDWAPAVTESHERGVLERQVVSDLLESLPAQQRAAIWLRVALEYTDEEVGQIMQVPTGTVKSWVWRSLARLRKACEGDVCQPAVGA